MGMIYVQFLDSSEQTIIGAFSCPQDATVFPNQGTVTAGDARWKAFWDLATASIQPYMPTPTKVMSQESA